MTTPTTAEAKARELADEILIQWLTTHTDSQIELVKIITAVLLPLIQAEESLKFRLEIAVSNADAFQSQLTETEARLKDAEKIIRFGEFATMEMKHAFLAAKAEGE